MLEALCWGVVALFFYRVQVQLCRQTQLLEEINRKLEKHRPADH